MAKQADSYGPRTRAGLVVVAGLFSLGLTACGSGPAASPTSRPPARSRRSLLSVAKVKGVGRILVDGAGMTLYAYIPDHQGKSRCYRVCQVQWPPLLITKGEKLRFGPGVNSQLVGTVRRRDGKLQLTYDHWPLYRYRLDSIPGQASGQEDDMGLWQVVAPSGQTVG